MITLVFQNESRNLNVAFNTTMINYYDENFWINQVTNIDALGSFDEQLANVLSSITPDLTSFLRTAIQFGLTLWGYKNNNKFLYIKNGVSASELQGQSIEPIRYDKIVHQVEEHFNGLRIGNSVTVTRPVISNYHLQVYRNGKLQLPTTDYIYQGSQFQFVRAFGYGQNQQNNTESVSIYYTSSIPI
jgi:hypothetical protein